jgi:hypothetical protein
MLVHLNIQDYHVTDIVMPSRYSEELSDVHIAEVLITFPPLLLRRFLCRIFQKYILPVALFLLFGLPIFLWGAFFGLYLWAHALITATIVLWFQSLLQAIVLETQETPR